MNGSYRAIQFYTARFLHPLKISQLRSIMLYVLLVFLNDGQFSAENQGIFGDSATIHRTRLYIFKHSMNSMSYLLPPPSPPPQHASSNFLIRPLTLDFTLSHFTPIYLQKKTYKRIWLDINPMWAKTFVFGNSMLTYASYSKLILV